MVKAENIAKREIRTLALRNQTPLIIADGSLTVRLVGVHSRLIEFVLLSRNK